MTEEEMKIIMKLDRIHLRMNQKTAKRHSMQELATMFALKGFGVFVGYFTENNFQYNLPPKTDHLILFTDQKEDFQQINALAEKFKRNANTLIVWDGDEQTKPDAKTIPVFSKERMFDKEGVLNWEELCKLAVKESPIAPEQLNKEKPASKWSLKHLFRFS